MGLFKYTRLSGEDRVAERLGELMAVRRKLTPEQWAGSMCAEVLDIIDDWMPLLRAARTPGIDQAHATLTAIAAGQHGGLTAEEHALLEAYRAGGALGGIRHLAEALPDVEAAKEAA